jgi:microcystin-dependent protein
MDIYLAVILPFAPGWTPEYFQQCNGQQLSSQQYAAIYALIGSNYGGGGSNFNLPDLRGRFPMHLPTPASMVGTKGGVAQLTVSLPGQCSITAANLPQHTHQAQFTPTTGTVNAPLAITAAGSLSGTATIPIDTTPGSGGVPSGSNNVLSGTPLSASNVKFPLGDTPTAGVSLAPVTVPVTASSNYSPAINTTVAINNVVTGGAVSVANGGGVPQPTLAPTVTTFNQNIMNPYLTMAFIFCMQGLWPTRA